MANSFERALRAGHYRKWAYGWVPNGFALVAQMERITRNGTPSQEPARWSTELPSANELTPLQFIKALAVAPSGYYRVIVFVVSDQPWNRTGERPTGRDAQRWLNEGANKLPAAIGTIVYGTDFTTTALVYEFTKASKQAEATQVEESDTPAEEHLKKAGIYDALSGWR